MEPTNEFNLEQKIQDWQFILTQNEQMKSEDASELASHLLDEMDSLKSKGLNDEEAFFIAQKRIGAIKVLVNEYEKVNPSFSFLKKLKPLILGILSYLVILEMIDVLSIVFTGIGMWTDFKLPNTIGVVCSCLLLVGLLLWGYKSTNIQRKKVVNLLFLGITLISLKAIYFGSHFYISTTISGNAGDYYSLFGYFKMQTVIFNAFLIGFLLIVSTIIYFKERKSRAFPLKAN